MRDAVWRELLSEGVPCFSGNLQGNSADSTLRRSNSSCKTAELRELKEKFPVSPSSEKKTRCREESRSDKVGGNVATNKLKLLPRGVFSTAGRPAWQTSRFTESVQNAPFDMHFASENFCRPRDLTEHWLTAGFLKEFAGSSLPVEFHE